jgi:hypothetical protein
MLQNLWLAGLKYSSDMLPNVVQDHVVVAALVCLLLV